MMANITLRFKNIFFGAALTLLAGSCTNEAEPRIPDPDEGRETSVVDISMSLGDFWSIDFDETRAAPPSTVNNAYSFNEIKDIPMAVRVVTFRRKEGSDGEFYYDKNNDMLLPVEATNTAESNHDNSETHPHRIAKGSLTKTYGYEYRVIGIAYPLDISENSYLSNKFPTSVGENYSNAVNSWMSISCETYSSFYAKLNIYNCNKWKEYMPGGTSSDERHINPQILQTPQLFYGILHSQYTDSDIIPYAEIDGDGDMNSKVDLTGILKRGVATVEIKIPTQTSTHGTQWITVLAETPNTKVSLTGYDDFLIPSEPLYVTYADNLDWGRIKSKYTAIAYQYIGGDSGEQQDQRFTFCILPCKTRLAIRVKTVESGFLGSTTTKLRNGQLTGDGIEFHGDNGTGIVSPDLIDDVFYFRRNHKYTITISNPVKVVEDHSLN